VLRNVATALVERALDIVDTQRPEMADRYMQVPLDYYNSEALAAREKEIFETTPLALVASTEIARPHDFLVRNAVGRSVLLTRDEDGKAHAFLNYCRHRGAEPAKGCGNARRFSCPYHAWTYDTRGRLVGMPLRDRHRDLDLGQYGLVELPSEERHGFVWVVLRAGHPIDVAAHLGDMDAELAGLGCANMTYYASLPEAPMKANWKCVAEGLLEGIHVPHVHPSTFGLNPQAGNVDLAFYDNIGPHIRYGMAMFDQDGSRQLRAAPRGDWQPERQIGCIWLIFPGMLIAQELYGLIYADLTPGPTVHDSFLRYGWLSPVSQAPEGMPSPEHMAARAARAIREDQPVWEGCARGLAQGQHGHALIGRNEKGVQLFHQMLARRIGYEGLSYR
jgi:phenylpropionate dioxygenase-like ring-hydroxylating dioxygenase large terminal subunit